MTDPGNSATSRDTAGPFNVLLCGACMSGNMGGQALYVSMAESLERIAGSVQVTVLSKYPEEDQPACEKLGWRMVPFPTHVQIVQGVPASVAYRMLRLLNLPRRWLAKGPLAAYTHNDVLIDLSGISFTDDRALSGLIINCLWLIPAVATGIPYVKASQTMGPFTRPVVRTASRFFLSRAAALVARGPISAQYLRDFLPNRTVHELPDVAFALRPAHEAEIDKALSSAGLEPDEPYCIVGPSYVVDAMMARVRAKDAYPELVASLVDKLAQLSGHKVLLVPHERAHTRSTLDDLHVCQRVLARMDEPNQARILEKKYPADVLKGIIGRAEVAVGSRFHFVVAAMSSGTPAMAITWSHKYREMMGTLGQGSFAVDHSGLTEQALLAKVSELWESRVAVQREIAEALPEVKQRAATNANVVFETLDSCSNFSPLKCCTGCF